MQTLVHEGRPEVGPERDVDLLIEKGFLLLGGIEFQIEEHLMSHGTRIDPETRLFMAKVRDAAGDAATKMLDEARNRLETTPADGAGEGAGPEAGEGEPAPAAFLPTSGAEPATAEWRGRGGPVALWRAAAQVGAGTAAASLFAALLLAGQLPSGTPTEIAGPVEAIEEAAVAAAPATERAGESVAAEWVSNVSMAAAAEPGEHKAKLAERASKPVADEPVQASAPATYPNLPAEAADAAKPEESEQRELAEALAALALRPQEPGKQPPYPDPRAGPVESAADADGSQAAAAAEELLALSRGARREVQRRLALARFDPQHFDGIFGPATRAALGGWQKAAGLPATGYLNAPALALLRDRTAGAYQAHLTAKKVRARQQPTRTVMSSPLPPISPVRTDGCRRTPSGRIVYGRGVRCDFRGLKQSIARLFG